MVAFSFGCKLTCVGQQACNYSSSVNNYVSTTFLKDYFLLPRYSNPVERPYLTMMFGGQELSVRGHKWSAPPPSWGQSSLIHGTGMHVCANPF